MPRAMLSRVEVDSSPKRVQMAMWSYWALVIGSFFFGWLLGVAVVFKLWQLAHAPRWLVLSGMGSVSFLTAPIISGALFSRAIGQLASRGWRGGRWADWLGACGLVAGLLRCDAAVPANGEAPMTSDIGPAESHKRQRCPPRRFASPC